MLFMLMKLQEMGVLLESMQKVEQLSNNFELDGGFWVLEGRLVGGDVTFNFDTTNALVYKHIEKHVNN